MKNIWKSSPILGPTAYKMFQQLLSATTKKTKFPNICIIEVKLEWEEHLISSYLE